LTPPFAEALAFEEAAGNCRQPLFLVHHSGSFSMRRLILIASVAMGLSACGKGGQEAIDQNAGENLTAESIVSNDVTAIDAVTGDAANMAADVDLNYGNLNEVSGNMPTTETQRPARTAPKMTVPVETNTVTNAPANTATNAE
jgi:hypothetical protein